MLVTGCTHRSEVDVADTLSEPLQQRVEATEETITEEPTLASHREPLAREPVTVEPRHHAPQIVADVDPPYLLDAGDKIRVFIYGQPNLSRVYSIDGGGFISVPLIGAVKARGESTYDLERAITVQLAAKYVRDPRVSIEIAQYRPFYILGEVRNAGQYAYVSGMTVETAVAIAGGYSERANERKVQISRRINGSIERMLVPPDTVVMPGDTIYVRERFF
jgi:polysaccharide export outer membrane protein